MTTFDIHHGDCLDVLRTLPDCSVDAVVTDPPYGLSFMGKRWDYEVPSVEIWAECLRVLKPGGHLLAFAGTRTQHRMCCRIEDAGFEIRDMIAWVYGSGFPKSLDVGKAIDKMDAADEHEQRRLRFTAWVRSHGVSSRQIDDATGTKMGGHYTTAASQPAIMTREHLEQCRHLFGDVPEWVERECDIRSVESRNFAKREVIGQKTSGIANKNEGDRHTIGASSAVVVDITAPATDAARQWAGWGTALKPALEPITVARKPLIGTVAENVLTHGTGAINVDGCRVAIDPDDKWAKGVTFRNSSQWAPGSPADRGDIEAAANPLGRWPANLIHDGSEEPTSLLGEAARFFYCPKASKSDRDEGLEHFAEVHRPNGNKWTDQDYRVSNGERPPSAESGPRRNHHPTVKPTDLMRYLCRLVTPPGGVVLDPFTGSGSTGKAAILEGFRFIGIEREAEYVEIAKARIAAAQPELLMSANYG